MESNVITVSRMRSFNACRRLHSIKYELGYRAIAKSENLTFGSLIHTGLEAWWKSGGDLSEAIVAMVEKPGDASEIDLVKAKVLMTGYDSRWLPEMADLEVIGVEMQFQCSIINPKTGYPCRELTIAGKIDAIARRRSTGKIWFFEHKTSSEDLAAGSTYWQRLRMDPQVSVYYGGMQALGHDVEGCVYDVLAKFRERPQLATPEDKRKYTKDGKLYAAQRAKDETLEEFSTRLADKMAENPESFFGRAEVIRTDSELIESQKDVHSTVLMIREEERLGRSPRNPSNCFLYNRTCEMFDICNGCGSLDDETRFKKMDSLHPELNLSNDNN